MSDPISFFVKSDDETMYYHQAIQLSDRNEFKKAIVKEIHDHCA